VSDDLVERLARVGDALANNMKYNAPPAFAHSVQLAIDKIQTQKSLIQEMREVLFWAEDKLYAEGYSTSMITEILSKAKSQQEGETE